VDQQTRQKIDAIWDGMCNNQMADPKTNITQITYLLFIKMLDDAQIKKEATAKMLDGKIENPTFKDGVYAQEKDANGNVTKTVTYADLRWHNFQNFETDRMFDVVNNYVFKFIRELHGGQGDAFSDFMSDAKLEIPNGKILEMVVRGLSDPQLNLDNKEIMGDVYEYLLAKLAINGDNGQFRTPRNIIAMMVQLMQPKLGEKICDPAMGSAGFLVESAKFIKEKYKSELHQKENLDFFNKETFYGNDTDRNMLRIGTMNMTLHEVSQPQIRYRNSLNDENPDSAIYDLVLANPPFTGNINANDISKSLTDAVSTKATELLFLALFMRILKIGGRCASVVPEGVLFRSGSPYLQIKKELVEKEKLIAVISLPAGVFYPYSGVSTGILIFDKTGGAGGTDQVWFYDVHNIGVSLDQKQNKIKENDFPDLIERFRNLDKENSRARTEQSFMVSRAEIIENKYSLRFSTYKQTIKKALVYRSSREILADIEKNDKELAVLKESIKKMVDD